MVVAASEDASSLFLVVWPWLLWLAWNRGGCCGSPGTEEETMVHNSVEEGGAIEEEWNMVMFQQKENEREGE